ncbi:hypothetical protein [Salinigranum marinum]|uniref:hypothetical protein n=1 Tax=Salinigranum marinum TaxID=1515595 RepID=UPI002989FF7A|nr:hypothetical protein [Salinigranum marinum]
MSHPGERSPTCDGFGVSFSPLTDDAGVLVVDPIERHQFRLFTPTTPALEPADPAGLRFPVDDAVRFVTERIELSSVVAVYVRDGEGQMLAEAAHFADESFEPGTYGLELCAPMKLYLRVEGAVSVTADATRTRLAFDGPTEVVVGGRSHHEQPAATLTTTDDPADVMRALSTFSSALKTTSVERSYPTLRGHPPLVERGDVLSIPDGLSAPKTGIRIELPRSLEHAYVAAPLAYYLGGELVPGDRPRIVTDTGFEHRLDTPRGFEREVERVLKQTFFFDCLVRTEGYYKVDLHERAAVEPAVDLDFAALYDATPAERLAATLSVPNEVIRDQTPEWKLTTHVAPTPDNVELLPFVVNDLAVVRTPTATSLSASEVQATAAGEFFRAGDGGPVRSAAADAGRAYVQPESADSLEQAWMGDGTPLGASKTTKQAFRNRLDRSPTAGTIDIVVVCNDERMIDERDVVDGVYGSREELPFDVTVQYGRTVAELRETLTTDVEFLHYIGHIDAAGFECADGRLDATTLDEVGPDAFLLNACQSYEQGVGLIDAGAIGGIVTLSDVINSGAVEMGKTLARLLNRGFPLGSALDVAGDDNALGSQYVVVGDGGFAIAQSESGVPNACYVHELDGDRFELEYKAFPTRERGMGTLIIPHLKDNETHYLSSGFVDSFDLTREELADFLSLADVPVVFENRLCWSSELDFDSL